jgi:RNA polymerase sigma-70 factor (ECF subfamily)
MVEAPTTRASLLVRLRDAQDALAWRQFVELYAPLVYRFARRKGLQDADAADLTQDVLRGVHSGVQRLEYDPQRGSFRRWLFTLAHRRLCDFLSRRGRGVRGSGDSAVQALLEAQAAPEETAAWEGEFRRRLFAWAAARVREQVSASTWQAFWLTAIEGQSGKEVARQLGLSPAAVYLAKSRVMVRLKEQLRQAEPDEQSESPREAP